MPGARSCGSSVPFYHTGVSEIPVLSLTARLRVAAAVALIALLTLCLAWELWLAPLRMGGSFLALKALPLALPLPGILRGRRYTYQWSSMLVLAYLAEGVMRAWGDAGLPRQLALVEMALSVAFFAAAVSFARLTRAAA